MIQKKLKKLKEINQIIKEIQKELETYIFIENINNIKIDTDNKDK